MRKLFLLALLCVSIFLITGCSLDSASLISYPEEVKPEGNANVMLSNIFSFIDTSANVSVTVKRDSIHLLVGMPTGWSVESVSFAVIRDLNLNELYISAGSETGIDTNMLKELIPSQSDFIPMSKDGNLINFMKGKSVVAYGSGENDSLSVSIDNIPKWEGFSAPVNIILEKGKRNGLVVPYDSVNNLSPTAGEGISLKPAFLGKVRQVITPNFDSLGITMVPIILSINLKAGKEQGKDTILYFTKTASMNEQPSPYLTMMGSMSPEMSSLLNLNWLFTPITISENAGIKERLVEKGKFSKVNIWSEERRGSVMIRYNKEILSPRKAEIYSLKGNLIKNIVANVNESCFMWDGTNSSGTRVSRGTYYIRITDKKGSIFTHSINILE
ncbi:MAG: hypothetical protein N2053_03085 [Chitinispirillaceae bacterium]|nr:hypothetical protein [Chitinispirillaceae bacterium]